MTQILQAVEEMKQTLGTSKQAIVEAKARQQEASEDVKCIERDMKEFSNNKDSKLAELQKSLEKLKTELGKGYSSIKPLQQELRETKFDLEQCGGDLAAAQEGLQETESTLKALKEEVADLTSQHKKIKVSQWLPFTRRCLNAHVIYRLSMTLHLHG